MAENITGQDLDGDGDVGEMGRPAVTRMPPPATVRTYLTAHRRAERRAMSSNTLSLFLGCRVVVLVAQRAVGSLGQEELDHLDVALLRGDVQRAELGVRGRHRLLLVDVGAQREQRRRELGVVLLGGPERRLPVVGGKGAAPIERDHAVLARRVAHARRDALGEDEGAHAEQ